MLSAVDFRCILRCFTVFAGRIAAAAQQFFFEFLCLSQNPIDLCLQSCCALLCLIATLIDNCLQQMHALCSLAFWISCEFFLMDLDVSKVKVCSLTLKPTSFRCHNNVSHVHYLNLATSVCPCRCRVNYHGCHFHCFEISQDRLSLFGKTMDILGCSVLCSKLISTSTNIVACVLRFLWIFDFKDCSYADWYLPLHPTCTVCYLPIIQSTVRPGAVQAHANQSDCQRCFESHCTISIDCQKPLPSKCAFGRVSILGKWGHGSRDDFRDSADISHDAGKKNSWGLSFQLEV